ncbi:hypothetical protein ACFU0X_10415 [Streptomyces cellulosae]|uniref:Uncharacterized protein n=1 Tax=Streptomyces cellulosae TaxID=1968 RepID=A0ABW6JDM8_STRCE
MPKGNRTSTSRSRIRRNPSASLHRACLDKSLRFDTREEAEKAAEEMRERKPWMLPREPYPCPYSHRKGQKLHFHIGRPLGRDKAA